MSGLASSKCIPCRRGDPALSGDEIQALLPEIPEWQLREVDGIARLERVIKLKNYAEALRLVNDIGAAAEEEDHHPLIILEWGRVTVQWWTHVVGGLHRNDFVMAARTDALVRN